MTQSLNPFAQFAEDNRTRPSDETASHLTDDPGHDYDEPETDSAGHTKASGISSPSEPRRPGGNTRQAPRREKDGALEYEREPIVPGEILYADGDVVINEGLEVTKLKVSNTSDRPIQIGSHYHFAEVNAALEFDRDAAWGKRLAVLSGGAERFEPGAVLEVELIPIEGKRIVLGLRGLCNGELDNAKG